MMALYQSMPGPGDLGAGPEYGDEPRMFQLRRREPPYGHAPAPSRVIVQDPIDYRSIAIDQAASAFREGDFEEMIWIMRRNGIQPIEVELAMVKGARS